MAYRVLHVLQGQLPLASPPGPQAAKWLWTVVPEPPWPLQWCGLTWPPPLRTEFYLPGWKSLGSKLQGAGG